MCPRIGLLSLALAVTGATGTVCGQDALKQSLALEEAIQQITSKVEPSIACILVSRSDAYKKFDRFSDKTVPGRLGDFVKPTVSRFHGPSSELIDRLDMADLRHVPDSYGSGVVIDPGGLILTNYHVVRDATKVFVRLPGQPGWYANIHAADERSDLAVLKLINLQRKLPALPIGDGSTLKKGQFILALANPYAAGFRDGSPSVTWGMVSNLRRRVPGESGELDRRRPRLHYYGVLLQTDLRLNLGCSGGALFDLKGNWIGLTTSQAAVAGGDTPGGFAIPFDRRLSRIVEVLRRGEEVEYGFMGISLNTPAPGSDGAYVRTVTPNSPAARAGFLASERILSINDEPIRDADDLFLNVAAALAGTEVKVSFERNGETRTAQIHLVKAYWPQSGLLIAANRPRPVHGLHVDYTSTLLRGQIGDATGIAPGVVVRETIPNSPAAKAGLKPEIDIIIEVNGKAVSTPREFYDAANRSTGPLELTLVEPPRKVTLP